MRKRNEKQTLLLAAVGPATAMFLSVVARDKPIGPSAIGFVLILWGTILPHLRLPQKKTP